MDKIAILIPCYNEELTIKQVIEDCKLQLPEATIYVYNNNSKDRTVEIATASGAIVRNEYKQGKGNVVRRMFREIDAECYIMIDGDNTYDLSSIKEMVDLVLNKNADMVVGDRLSSTYFKENKRPFHNFGNSIVKFSVNKLFKSNIKDIMSGYRAFSYQFVKSFPVLSNGFEIETEMTIHCLDKRMQVENHVIEYRDRPEGSVSKLNTYKDGFRVLKTIHKLYRFYKPMSYYLRYFILSFLIASTVFGFGLYDYYKPLDVNFPFLLTSIILYVISFATLFTGKILSEARHRDHMQFEAELIRINDELKNKLNK